MAIFTRKFNTDIFIKGLIFLLISTSFPLFLLSCTKVYKLEAKDASQYGYEVWQGHFVVQDGVQIPLLFGVESKTGIRQVRIFSGSELAYWSYWDEGERWHDSSDSVSFKSGLHSEFRGIRKGDKVVGAYFDGVGTKVERAKFVVEKVDKQQSPFIHVAKPTNVLPTGTWQLDFGTLKDLSDPGEVLRYNIDRVQTFDIYRSNDTIIGQAYGAGGIQGFDGLMTADGFICSSFHHSEPFLIEAIFVDENTFEAKITSTTDVYEVRGSRKSQTEEDAEYTGSMIIGLYLALKGFFRW